MRNVQSTVCMLLVMVSLCANAIAQSMERSGSSKTARSNDDSQVEVKKDEFSGVTTITLKLQKLIDSPNHQLTMSAETKLGGEAPKTGLRDADETIEIVFTSLSKSGIDFGDKELHFLVDGKRLRIGEVAESIPYSNKSSQRSELRVGGHLTVVFPLSQLQQIADGKNVAMRLGTIEVTLDSKLLSNLRNLVRAVSSVATNDK